MSRRPPKTTGDTPPLDALAVALGPCARRDEPLGARTTYRVGGSAAVFVEADDEPTLLKVHRALAAAEEEVPVLVLGNGSNLLVADEGFAGLVVWLGRGFADVLVEGRSVRAGGAAKLPVVARRSAAAGLHGLEWAVGVPGTVGGALRMNAGGHGSDIAAVLSGYRVFDLVLGRGTNARPEQLELGYRRSSLSSTQVVTWADFALSALDRERAEANVAEVVRWRAEHQPGGPNAGSVFTNPPGDSAGRLVEAAGCKGRRHGSAEVSTKHANFIQADRGGSAADVRRLVEEVRQAVAERTGIELVPELHMVGFDDSSMPPGSSIAAPGRSRGRPRSSASTGGRGL